MEIAATSSPRKKEGKIEENPKVDTVRYKELLKTAIDAFKELEGMCPVDDLSTSDFKCDSEFLNEAEKYLEGNHKKRCLTGSKK